VQTPAVAGGNVPHGAAALKFKIEGIRRLASADKNRRPIGPRPTPVSTAAPADRLIVIGASAGGPATLATILSALPPNFPAAIVVVQHVDPQFVPLMADWLNARSALSVRVARQGDPPQSNTVLIAGTSDHLVFLNS